MQIPRWAGHCRQGIVAALAAAVFFGCGTPLAKMFLAQIDPWMLAGLLYLGSGTGLALYRTVSRASPVRLAKNEVLWFLGAIVSGGVVAPVLMMVGLTNMEASTASLLLNAEGVFTALLAWFAFKENFDRRILLGMLAIMTGAVILSWPDEISAAGLWPSAAILGACFAWAIDNNLTRKVSLTDATWIASRKGMAAGAVNLALSLALGAALPPWLPVAGAMTIGLIAYGISLSLFVVSLRHLGSARTGAYFSIAPFWGALLAVMLGESLTPALLLAGALMALGLWLHLTERHEHAHTHKAFEHEHEYVHDNLHSPLHEGSISMDQGFKHRHDTITHTHAHFPDVHHQHDH